MTGYFGIIDSSSPHIYHSALALAPKTSTVRKLYEPYARPFTRVVHGLPSSWDSSTASRTIPYPIHLVVWSPCNRFIAISQMGGMVVDLLDSTTLKCLQRLIFSRERYARSEALVFSPDSRSLTCSGCGSAPDQEVLVVSWDLQTGGVISAIERQGLDEPYATNPLIAYSTNGRMVAVHRHESAPIISIYDVISGVYMHDVHHVIPVDHRSTGGSRFPDIWAHGETFRFATVGLRAITIWEVGFNPGATSAVVETLSIPPDVEYFLPIHAQLLPASGRHTLVYHSAVRYGVLVWDGQDARSSVLDTDIDLNRKVSFSSDGRLFAYFTTSGSEAYLWKESPAGYVLHGKFTPGGQYPRLLLSPNGESIVEYSDFSLRLRPTEGFTTPSNTPTRAPHRLSNFIPESHPDQPPAAVAHQVVMVIELTPRGLGLTTPSNTPTAPHRLSNFILEFHPDRPLAAVARRKDDAVIVLDLTSGALQLTIETGMVIQGIRVVRNTVTVIGDWKVVTWNLPGGDFLPDARVDVESSIQTINFDDQQAEYGTIAASISLDLRYVALTSKDWLGWTMHSRLHVYDLSTGQHLYRDIDCWDAVWFRPGGDHVWCASRNLEVAEISQDSMDDMDDASDMDHFSGVGYATEVVGVEDGPWGCPWGSSRGYWVTKDGWIFDPDGKRLLMLPLSWISLAVHRVWSGKFLALVHGTLPEPIILELEPSDNDHCAQTQ